MMSWKRDNCALTALESLNGAGFQADAVQLRLPFDSLSQFLHLLLQIRNKLLLLLFVPFYEGSVKILKMIFWENPAASMEGSLKRLN